MAARCCEELPWRRWTWREGRYHEGLLPSPLFVNEGQENTYSNSNQKPLSDEDGER